MADLSGGASGILVRDYKGKEADRLVAPIDPGVVSLVADPRGHARQAAEELEQTVAEEREVIDADGGDHARPADRRGVGLVREDCW